MTTPGTEPLQPASAQSAPSLHGIFETALYVDDLAKADRFYTSVLGLQKILTVPGRQLVFRCQESILLVFDPRQTEADQVVINGGAIPRHGTRGPGHIAFRVPQWELATWRERLQAGGIAIESEIDWPGGAHSIYFRDPAGNSLELATPDMWVRTDLLAPQS